MSDLVFRLDTDKKHEVVIGTIEVEVTFPDGSPAAGLNYTLALDKGGERKGVLDNHGRLRESNIPAGAKGTLAVKGAPVIGLVE